MHIFPPFRVLPLALAEQRFGQLQQFHNTIAARRCHIVCGNVRAASVANARQQFTNG